MRSGREDIDQKLQAESLILVSSMCQSLASVSKFVIVEVFFFGFVFVQLACELAISQLHLGD